MRIRPVRPEGMYVKSEYWTRERIGVVPDFPILIFDQNDGGSITGYESFGQLEVRWNQFLFENHISKDFPTFIVDAGCNIFLLQFHKEKFNYPKFLWKIDRMELLELLEDCELDELSDYEILETAAAILERLLQRYTISDGRHW